ncbi:hypothetical protein NB723_000232 [Xanthomonas sacchari]|nr:hypothetical protein [Xanthomonas sacchari]
MRNLAKRVVLDLLAGVDMHTDCRPVNETLTCDLHRQLTAHRIVGKGRRDVSPADAIAVQAIGFRKNVIRGVERASLYCARGDAFPNIAPLTIVAEAKHNVVASYTFRYFFAVKQAQSICTRLNHITESIVPHLFVWRSRPVQRDIIKASEIKSRGQWSTNFARHDIADALRCGGHLAQGVVGHFHRRAIHGGLLQVPLGIVGESTDGRRRLRCADVRWRALGQVTMDRLGDLAAYGVVAPSGATVPYRHPLFWRSWRRRLCQGYFVLYGLRVLDLLEQFAFGRIRVGGEVALRVDGRDLAVGSVVVVVAGRPDAASELLIVGLHVLPQQHGLFHYIAEDVVLIDSSLNRNRRVIIEQPVICDWRAPCSRKHKDIGLAPSHVVLGVDSAIQVGRNSDAAGDIEAAGHLPDGQRDRVCKACESDLIAQRVIAVAGHAAILIDVVDEQPALVIGLVGVVAAHVLLHDRAPHGVVGHFDRRMDAGRRDRTVGLQDTRIGEDGPDLMPAIVVLIARNARRIAIRVFRSGDNIALRIVVCSVDDRSPNERKNAFLRNRRNDSSRRDFGDAPTRRIVLVGPDIAVAVLPARHQAGAVVCQPFGMIEPVGLGNGPACGIVLDLVRDEVDALQRRGQRFQRSWRCVVFLGERTQFYDIASSTVDGLLDATARIDRIDLAPCRVEQRVRVPVRRGGQIIPIVSIETIDYVFIVPLGERRSFPAGGQDLPILDLINNISGTVVDIFHSTTAAIGTGTNLVDFVLNPASAVIVIGRLLEAPLPEIPFPISDLTQRCDIRFTGIEKLPIASVPRSSVSVSFQCLVWDKFIIKLPKCLDPSGSVIEVLRERPCTIDGICQTAIAVVDAPGDLVLGVVLDQAEGRCIGHARLQLRSKTVRQGEGIRQIAGLEQAAGGVVLEGANSTHAVDRVVQVAIFAEDIERLDVPGIVALHLAIDIGEIDGERSIRQIDRLRIPPRRDHAPCSIVVVADDATGTIHCEHHTVRLIVDEALNMARRIGLGDDIAIAVVAVCGHQVEASGRDGLADPSSGRVVGVGRGPRV